MIETMYIEIVLFMQKIGLYTHIFHTSFVLKTAFLELYYYASLN